MAPTAVFILVVALQTEFSLFGQFSRHLECATDGYTCCVDIEKDTTGFLMKSFWGVLREHGIDVHLLVGIKSLYSCSDACARAMRVESR